MMGEPLPKGYSDRDPIPTYDLLSAVNRAKALERKAWFRVRGDEAHLYEVWPGGRNIAWPRTILETRRKRQECLHADHRCPHAWETHTDSQPTAAGMHVEEFQQCLKCGEIRETAEGEQQ